MILISHRGNVNGVEPLMENKPEYIDNTILNGYDVEIDVWYIDNSFWLGHDNPQYRVDFDWILDRIDKLWIHCKNVESVLYFKQCGYYVNYFWHEIDKLTLTSKGYIWVYPGNQPINKSIAVMPEISDENIFGCEGVCSDYIEKYKIPILKVTHNAGFFSCCTIRLMDVINFHNKNKLLPMVDSSEQWSSYKDVKIDISDKFFKNKIQLNNFNPSFMIDSNYENQFSDYSLINYEYVNKLIDRYFTPSDEVSKIELDLIEKYKINLNNTLTICYRGNDKNRETILPNYGEMLIKINELVLENPSYEILLQTDEIEFQDVVKNLYPNVKIIEETKKIHRSDTAIQYTIPIGERLFNAKIFLATMFIMSKTSKIILNSGNVGMWICLFRGNYEGVYQYLNHGNGINIKKWLK